MKKTLIIIIATILVIAAGIFVYLKYYRYQADVVVTSLCGDDVCGSDENAQSCSSDCFKTITWANSTKTWSQNLGLSGFRMGCSSEPAGCIIKANSYLTNSGVPNGQMYISMTTDGTLVANYAQEFSNLSLGSNWLKEVAIDDFVGAMGRWQTAGINTADLTNQITTNIKSVNPDLKFGITFYGYEFGKAAISEENFPLSAREKIDFVHLYTVYRGNAPKYESYVTQAKALFPNAKIIAGSYDIDRIDRIQCFQGGDQTKCTKDQELGFFSQQLNTEIELLKSAQIYAIEFYPGFFEPPGNWQYFSQPQFCLAERQAECIANSAEMENIVLTSFNEARGTSAEAPTSGSEATLDQTNQESASYESGADQPRVAFNDSQTSQTATSSNESSSQVANDPGTTSTSSQESEDLTEAGLSLFDSIILSFFFALVAIVLVWYGSTLVGQENA